MFQVTEIVRFLLERGLRFRNLGFCGHNLMQTATFNAPVPIHPERLAFFPPFLEGHDEAAAMSQRRMTMAHVPRVLAADQSCCMLLSVYSKRSGLFPLH
jgi:hypothetical protein